MSEDGDGEALSDVLSLLDDDHARTILVETTVEPMSAQELAERCDVADSTIYRRIDRLREYDLLVETQQIDREGNHYKQYRARLDHVTIDLDSDGFSIELARVDEEPVDRFRRLYEELR